MPKPVIDYGKCKDCDSCIDVCPVGCFGKKDKHTVVDKPQECIGCKACEVQCPNEAIKVLD